MPAETSMIETLRQYITARVGSNTGQIDQVLQKFRPIKVKRDAPLLRQGEVCGQVYFVVAGCLQVYVYDTAYNETTRDIVLENHWCSELVSFGSQKPATENIRAIEDCHLLAIGFQSFQELMRTVPPFAQIYQQILEASYANSVSRVNTLVSLTALEKIRWLQNNRPDLTQRVSNRLVASYLGMSQETYSRLKQKT